MEDGAEDGVEMVADKAPANTPAVEGAPVPAIPGADKHFGFERRIRAGAARYHCNYCQRDITNLFRIKCADCQDFDLCLECFSVGVEVFPHQKTHSYRVMDNMTFPIFEASWGADEELLLLEAIQMYGMGNWIDVAEHVGTKTLAECKDHYFSTYINVPTIPIPDPARAVDPTQTERRAVTNRPDRKEVVKAPKAAPNLNDSRSLNFVAKAGKDGSTLPQSDVQGYMPLRNDFESEFDNDAEMIIADMEILPTDPPEDRSLKTKLLKIYDAKLNERQRRKAYVLERGLLDFKRQHAQERRKPKEERELIQRLKVFSRFHSKEEHQQLVDGILRERELRRRIALLQEYRRAGIRTLSEAHAYHVDKKKHEEELRKASDDGSSRGRAGGSRYLARDRSLGPCPDWKPSKFLRKHNMLDISKCQGVELLSDKEKHLCSTLRIIPKQYMLIKDVLIRECERVGYLKPDKASQMLKIEAVKTGKLYEFFVSSGWIKQGHVVKS